MKVFVTHYRMSNVRRPSVKEESAEHFIQFKSGATTTQCQQLCTTYVNNYMFDSLRAKYN